MGGGPRGELQARLRQSPGERERVSDLTEQLSQVAVAEQRAFKKVIIVGLDGFEPKLVDALLEAGDLPHLARLRAQGGYGRVATTNPALTPAAWSTFATGTNPGKHGIF